MEVMMVVIVILALWPLVAVASPPPFVVLHGVLDACKNEGVCQFTQFLMAMSGAKGYCLEVGNGVSDSFFMRMDRQVEAVCKQVKAIPELQHGFNLVGLSQGGLIGRAVIELCDGAPPVHNFISVAAPHAGTASVPLCGVRSVCMGVNAILKLGIYSEFVQQHIGPAGYVKIPDALDEYYRGCLFLPNINNEVPGNRNPVYKSRFSKLHHLVLIMFEGDKVLIPAQTAWFGYFPPNDYNTVLPAHDTTLYKEDWIGLRCLHEAGNVSFISLCGGHLDITEFEALNYILPFLENSPKSAAPTVAGCGVPSSSPLFHLMPDSSLTAAF